MVIYGKNGDIAISITMQAELFLPIQGVKFSDLFDWKNQSQNGEKSPTIVNRPPGLTRQNSRAGALTECNGEKLAIFRHGEEVFALDERCPHAGGPLHLGDIESLPDLSLCVRCPWHSWRFDVKTGQVKHPKGRKLTAHVYPVRVKEDGTLLVGFHQLNQKYFTDGNF